MNRCPQFVGAANPMKYCPELPRHVRSSLVGKKRTKIPHRTKFARDYR
jgi:hypothetical protein